MLAKPEDILSIARLEAQVILAAVRSRDLPVCDLGIPHDLTAYWKQVVLLGGQSGLLRFVENSRRMKLDQIVALSDKRIILARCENGKIIGKGVVGLNLEKNIISLSGFYVHEGYRDGAVVLALMKAAISVYEDLCNDATSIVLGRYDMSETKRGLLTTLARMVNETKSDLVRVEEFVWKGQKGKYYFFPKDVALELMDEIGGKIARFLV